MLTQRILDRMVCEHPDCPHETDHEALFVVPRCHPEAAVDVFYNKDSGCLVVECHECHTFVAEIGVAE